MKNAKGYFGSDVVVQMAQITFFCKRFIRLWNNFMLVSSSFFFIDTSMRFWWSAPSTQHTASTNCDVRRPILLLRCCGNCMGGFWKNKLGAGHFRPPPPAWALDSGIGISDTQQMTYADNLMHRGLLLRKQSFQFWTVSEPRHFSGYSVTKEESGFQNFCKI